ncbi:acyl-CoA dehydrogenase family protein [Candidatus Mycobacterium wuenschmannii]|uniref:Acyl-CoA dehydrogenase family protein n=1 Tax=Candidatus Mycobacterium wuenschmannii TaxID=3027808 RepID=A0ABY8VZ59_9MYCO|nr:acyl-CoA dehydrogenase family protein [Candidatus Mycobacterium wuenschmannii]WIM86784.1 acyl-CoA dehydrogenase family protein [Candidatus Mycobacterium wuenschmannii]
MTTELDHVRPVPVARDIVDQIADSATDLDEGARNTRDNLALLAHSGLLGLGAPDNHDHALPKMAAVIAELAGHCLSTAFSVWAHRMTLEYLTAAGTPWSLDAATALTGVGALGVTGMASAFKDAAGCGSIEVSATPVGGGFRLDGTLRWASNLYPDSIMVTAAQTESGDKIVVGLPLAAEGVTIGDHFELLALGSTASSSVKLDGVYVGDDRVLSRDIAPFLADVRPTFLVLQSAMCVGLARRCLDEVEPSLSGVNSAFAVEFDDLTAELADIEAQVDAYAAAVGGPGTPAKHDLLTLRLAAADTVSAAAALEIRTAGGKGYARRTDAGRRFREAAFIPVQSPSEAQLRWELRTGR